MSLTLSKAAGDEGGQVRVSLTLTKAAGGGGGQAAAALPKPPKRWAKRHLFGARFSLSRSTTSLA